MPGRVCALESWQGGIEEVGEGSRGLEGEPFGTVATMPLHPTTKTQDPPRSFFPTFLAPPYL